MKNKFVFGLLAVGLFSFGTIAACGGGDDKPAEQEYSFTAELEGGVNRLKVSETKRIAVKESAIGGDREFIFKSGDEAIVTVSSDGYATGVKEGTANVLIKENKSGKTYTLKLTVSDAEPASGGYNYSALGGDESIKVRTEILGKLEKYAMDNNLTGITLFENGGYVKYSSRVRLGTENYVTGYGFGLLSEGELTEPMETETTEKYKMYLHSAQSSDPKLINARNDNGSQVSSLESYITSSFWSTKLSKTDSNKYEWYPLLAKDKITHNGKEFDFNRPLPVHNGNPVYPDQEDPDPLKLYRTWRIYVKTGEDGLRYRSSSTIATGYDRRGVSIDDYEFAYRYLLTGSHKLKRGPEAATDLTYGLVGAQTYHLQTQTADDEQAIAKWNEMKSRGQLGIKTGADDANGSYIELTILNPIDRFTAMYVLSSSLYSPIPESFIREIGDGSVVKGAPMYGSFNNTDSITDYTINLGAYMIERWDKNQQIVFERNEDWIEKDRYKIAGVKLLVIDTSTSTTAVYDKFYHQENGSWKGVVDSCGIPTVYLDKERGQPGVYQTKGDSTFKLNVNSCDQATWDELFGPNGKINKGSQWDVKPWMSNKNFLNGLFYSIDRGTFAKNRGVQPSINYFSDAYLSDPENGVSYNSTQEHLDAISAYQTYDKDGNPTYGYSKDKAVLSFKQAVRELAAQGKITLGSEDNPTEIHISIMWMYPTDPTEYGDEIVQYFTDAFNDPKVCDGAVKLIVDQDYVNNWQDVYNEYLMKGQFDLGFGAISGNTYNPLNFLEVLKSDNSSGFTLNWGTDTSVVTPNSPISFDGNLWSFDALWAVADHGGIINNGQVVKSVQACYLTSEGNDWNFGKNFTITTQFVSVPNVELKVSGAKLYVIGGMSYDLELAADGSVVIDAELANTIRLEIIRVFKLDKEPNIDDYPFVMDKYGIYWQVEVYYTLSIGGGSPTESYLVAGKNKDAPINL